MQGCNHFEQRRHDENDGMMTITYFPIILRLYAEYSKRRNDIILSQFKEEMVEYCKRRNKLMFSKIYKKKRMQNIPTRNKC